MKIKVETAAGAVLDYLVGTLEGRKPRMFAGALRATAHPDFPDSPTLFGPEQRYSTLWAQGGLIIERERINVGESIHPTMDWTATIYVADEEAWQMSGPTPLIAAMRCFVISKLGPEVEIPGGLA